MAARDVRVLSFHAGYRCRNSGVCCTSDWPIPMEADRLGRVQAAIDSRQLSPARTSAGAPFLFPDDAPAETPAVLATCEGACVFHEPAGRCAIQQALGHEALPLACRQFPRISVVDPRGVSVTLSHYCPTTASLLATGDVAIEPILLNVPGFPATGEYVGLDAVTVLPPLLRETVLMDWESWWEFERLSVRTLLRSASSAAGALACLRGAVRRLERWSPAESPLLPAIRDAFNAPAEAGASTTHTLVATALAAVPEGFREQATWTSTSTTDDVSARRFLAAHAFGNWAIHSRAGLKAWLASIETANAFLEAGAGVRHADLVLRHLAETQY